MTAPRFSLDTSCVLNLLNPDETINDDLVKLLRLGLMGDAQLWVTETCPTELAETAAAHGRRSEIAKRAAILPILATPAEKIAERDTLAARFFKALWPNSSGKGKKADHSRRDCEHLAAHVLGDADAFVTRDDKLRNKVNGKKPHASLVVLSPTDALARAEAARPKRMVFATQSFGVRAANIGDRDALAMLLTPLRGSYPDFDGWLTKTLSDASTVVNLGVVNRNDINGVAIWKPKDSRTAKLSTFFLHPNARNLGLGQHMLFHCLRQWVEKKIERAYVTVSAQHEDVLSLCVNFGFRIEGSAQRRYATGESELVLTKHLVYLSVADAALAPWLDELARTIFSIHPPNQSSAPGHWFVPPKSTQCSATWDPAREVVEIHDGETAAQRLGLRQVEELFYPVRVSLKDRGAYVIPIQPQWAERMMEIPRQQETLFQVTDKLRLRIENAYYCAPVYAVDRVEGAPIVFYVSSPDSALTGMARMISRVIAEPEDLFLRFGELGVYQLDDIKRHVGKRGPHKGCAMAMRFGWWVPFPKPITLKAAVDAGFLHAHPQRTLRVTYASFEAMMKLGGLDW